MEDDRFEPSPRPSLAWFWQVATGAALILLLGLHLVVQHFVVRGGLRDFSDVVSYLRNPVVLALEVVFLVVVVSHAMLGLRATVLDLGLSDRAGRWTSRLLAAVGAATVGYGLWLTWAIVR